MPPLARIAALCLLIAPSPTLARPFTLDDLLGTEGLGGAYISPGGRWLVVEHTAPYDSARTYDDDGFMPFALSRLDVVDLAAPDPAKPLVEGAAGEGVNPGPFSPDGRRMAVFRLQGHSWTLGLADLKTRTVRWLDLTVETANWGRTAQWRSNGTLIAIAMAEGVRPNRTNRIWAEEERPPQRWADATAGKVATDTVVGSGRFRDLTPKGPATRLVSVDAQTGATTVLAAGEFFDLELAPSGAFAALLGDEDAIQPRADEVLRMGTMARKHGLTLVNLATGAQSHPCQTLDVATHLLSWAPRRNDLLVYGREAGGDWTRGTLARIDAQTAICQPVVAAGLRPAVLLGLEGLPIVRADWLGDDPILLAEPTQAAPGGRQDWHRIGSTGAINLTRAMTRPGTLTAVDEKGVVAVDGSGAWWIDRSGRASRLSATFNRPVAGPGPGDGDRMAYAALRGPVAWLSDGVQVAKVAEGRIGADMALPPGAMAVAANDHAVVSASVDAHGVSTVNVQARGEILSVLSVNQPLGAVTFCEPRAVRYLGTKGEPLTGWLSLPPGLPPGRKPPLVVVPYPGAVYPRPPRAYAAGYPLFQVSPHLLAAAGYAVLVPSLPRDWSSHEPADGLADQILVAVDAADRTGLVDVGRMVLWGHSWGGYATLVAATQTHRFKAMIEASGKSDLVSAYGPFSPPARSAPEDGISPNSTMGWMENGQGNLGVSPAQDIERYARNSPAFHADRIDTPILLIHGDMDFVPLAQGEEMFSALYRQNKDAVLVTLWGEGHTVQSPANIRKMYGWIFWWLDRTVGPGVTG